MGKVIVIKHPKPKFVVVGEWLKGKGFDLANPDGISINTVYDLVIGILKPKPTSFLSFLHHRPKRTFLGRLELVNPSETPTWTLSVYGEIHKHEMQQLADQIAHDFNVDVNMVIQPETRDEYIDKIGYP